MIVIGSHRANGRLFEADQPIRSQPVAMVGQAPSASERCEQKAEAARANDQEHDRI
tara:strand:+ start:4935 stop:5102 length:168 start_codon:yes stop_codon:yes gene_type:complete